MTARAVKQINEIPTPGLFDISGPVLRLGWMELLFICMPVEEVRKLREESGENIVILGSGSIVSQLAPAGLIDEYQIVLNPIVLGDGRTMFEGVKEKLSLKLTKSRAFRNGNVLLCYEPMR